MERRDALMVTGFDLLGHNRTFQIHWVKRLVAYFFDLSVVFGPLFIFLYALGERRPVVFSLLGGVFLYLYSTAAEAVFRRTFGKLVVDLEVRALKGPMTFSKAAVRNIPKLFWFAFPLFDTIAGLAVDGDPRQRWSDKVLGTTVAQSHLVHVRVHPIRTWDAGPR
ncbi:MAG: hypothetical protein A3K66_01950 [Euryarchaeota archaeon RBG_16_67_27]|nr:MAG: hypothetical protein A3K66_01950 [Euryarchaeota archaeon RBG_16_67_27]